MESHGVYNGVIQRIKIFVFWWVQVIFLFVSSYIDSNNILAESIQFHSI